MNNLEMGDRTMLRQIFAELNKFYGKANWKELFEGKAVQENMRYI